MIDASNHKIDFLNYLCDQALNLEEGSIESEKPAEELFFSEDFTKFTDMVNSWKDMRILNAVKFSDMILQYTEEMRDLAAQTLIFLWPFLHVVVENLK